MSIQILNSFSYIYKFIINNMSNPELYVNHPLNTSNSKQTYSFSKSDRFHIKRKSLGDVMYDLPSSITRRSCSFGVGNKVSFAEKEKSPPPGTYQPPTDFTKIARYNTISFHIGRNQVKFGSFLADTGKKNAGPSPNAYRIKTQHYYDKRGGRMAAKLPTQIDLIAKKKTPGPGTYKLDITDMKGVGSYVLSNYPNYVSPKYLSPSHENRSRSPAQSGSALGPGQYDLSRQKIGQSLISKFKNSITCSFGKESRPGMQDKTKRGFPGFKYKSFSQFKGVQN